jgi:chondroitin AC lyase
MTRVFVFLAVLYFTGLAYANPDLEILRKKVLSEMLQSSVNERTVRALMESVLTDGKWPGIDYVDVTRIGFQHTQHLNNMVTLCRAYKKEGSQLKGDPRLKKVIDISLNFWLANDFICDNWWNNQIGTPDQFVKILLILDDDLTDDQRTRSVAIAYRANLSASGARPSGDRIKIAGILAKNALFQRNDSLFDSTIKVIAGEIKFSTGPGLQYDYSFHHRTDRVTSTLSYGMGYADAFAEWAALVSGTRYAFPERALKLLVDYYIDGICQTMVYGKYPDPGAENRSVSRVGSLRPIGSSTPERLAAASSYRKDELEKIIRIRKGEIKPDLTGSWFFWDSEYYSVQRPGYFTSVRMFSSRNHNMEMPYNSEGLMNHHYADGSNFISRTGDEYYDIYPVFDWQKIPGTTIVQKPSLPSENEIQKKGLTEFVGGVTDGSYGAAVFDFKSLHDPLTAKKAWFFFEKEYVCLGTGITSSSEFPVSTTINQCLLHGEVTVMSENKKAVVQKGDHKINNVKWIVHDSVGYLFPEPVNLNLLNNTIKGSWYKINHQSDSPKEEISKEVFKLWIDHGNRPVIDKYQYIVIPLTNTKEFENYAKGNEIKILSNIPDIQAVMHSGLGICQIVFYKAGEIQVTSDLRIGAETPGIVMVRFKNGTLSSVSVSDPSRKLGTMHLTASYKFEKHGENFSSVWDKLKSISNISIVLPADVYAGKSVTIQ